MSQNIMIDGHATGPDPHGQAALLVAEALMHVLIEKGVLDRGDALDILQTSTSVKEDVLVAHSEPSENALASMALLKKMSLSFEQARPGDGDGNGGAPVRHDGDGHWDGDGDGHDRDGIGPG